MVVLYGNCDEMMRCEVLDETVKPRTPLYLYHSMIDLPTVQVVLHPTLQPSYIVLSCYSLMESM
jgi:hypothetical protein